MFIEFSFSYGDLISPVVEKYFSKLFYHDHSPLCYCKAKEGGGSFYSLYFVKKNFQWVHLGYLKEFNLKNTPILIF